MERLSQAARDVLATASVVGRAFELTVLEAVSGKRDDTLLDVIEEAERAQLILPHTTGPEAGFVFAHELIRQTLVVNVSMPRRQRLHLQIAEAIQQVYATNLEQRAPQLAHHLYQAGSAADPAKTVQYLELAGEQAMAATAYEEAAGHFERALQIIEPKQREERQYCEIALALGAALWSAGDLKRAGECFTEAFQCAKKLRAPELLAGAVLGLGEGWGWVPNELMAGLLEDVLDAQEERDDVLRAKTMARLAVELQAVRADNKERSEDLSTQAVEMARREGDNATLGYTLACWGSVFLEVADARDRLAAATDAIRLADPGFWATLSHQQRLTALLQLGEIAAVDQEIDTLQRLSDEQAEPFVLWEALRSRSMRALLDGRFLDAERLIQEHLAVARRMGRFQGAWQTSSVHMLVLRWMQGRAGELEAPARASVERSPENNWVWRAALVFIYCELGQEAAARRELEALPVGDLPRVPRQRGWVLTAVLLAEVCAVLRDTGRAQTLYNMLLPLAEQHLTSRADGYLGPAGVYLGNLADILGRSDDAARHFEHALEMTALIHARPWVAKTQYDFARTLLARRRSGDRGRARELLDQALSTAEGLGMASLAGNARKMLGAPALAAPSYPAGLSPREVEVLALLARGRSSREIGDELVLAVRTVERHITNIYRKIEAHNRAQATAFALKHGLTGS